MADAGDLKSPGVIPRAGSTPALPNDLPVRNIIQDSASVGWPQRSFSNLNARRLPARFTGRTGRTASAAAVLAVSRKKRGFPIAVIGKPRSSYN